MARVEICDSRHVGMFALTDTWRTAKSTRRSRWFASADWGRGRGTESSRWISL